MRQPGALQGLARGRHRADAHEAGSTPAEPVATMRASGSRPSSLAARLARQHSAAAPSLSVDELPAVTVPPSRKAG